jgi:hypothetical protein
MTHAEVVNRSWENFKERIRTRWEGLESSDLDLCRHDYRQLVDKIYQGSNDSREAVQNYVDNLWFEIFVRASRQTWINLEHASGVGQEGVPQL